MVITVEISIHAPMKDATKLRSCCRYEDTHFNPRTHEGCDSKVYNWLNALNHFNPRTHEGCDIDIDDDTIKILEFQSTHP